MKSKIVILEFNPFHFIVFYQIREGAVYKVEIWKKLKKRLTESVLKKFIKPSRGCRSTPITNLSAVLDEDGKLCEGLIIPRYSTKHRIPKYRSYYV